MFKFIKFFSLFIFAFVMLIIFVAMLTSGLTSVQVVDIQQNELQDTNNLPYFVQVDLKAGWLSQIWTKDSRESYMTDGNRFICTRTQVEINGEELHQLKTACERYLLNQLNSVVKKLNIELEKFEEK